MYTFTYLALFISKLEPTEVQDAAKQPNFEFGSYPPPRKVVISP